MTNHLQILSNEIRKACTADQYAWFVTALDQLRSGNEPLDQLVTYITQARRNLGILPLSKESTPVESSAGTIKINVWSATDAGRIAFLLSVLQSNETDLTNTVSYIYKMGDEAENTSIIKGLALYSNDDSLKSVALEGGRTNSRPLFSALALHNPYPAAYYSEHEFNQIILKALFIGLSIETVYGLKRRANRELSRMAEDYLEERVAAGRSIPTDIWLALAPYCSEQGEKLITNAVSDANAGHRYYAAKSIALYGKSSPDIHDALSAQLEIETDLRVREIIHDALTTLM